MDSHGAMILTRENRRTWRITCPTATSEAFYGYPNMYEWTVVIKGKRFAWRRVFL
jgi:hypothetical protein